MLRRSCHSNIHLMEPYQDRKIRFGIVGCGAIGPTHAGAAASRLPDVEVVAVADLILDRAQATADKFSVPKNLSRPETTAG